MTSENFYEDCILPQGEPLNPDVILGPDTFDDIPLAQRFNSADLNDTFSRKLDELIIRCKNLGAEMVPHNGVRDPWHQAKLWRQSRSSAEVEAAIQKLSDDSAPFLADVLESVGPQPAGPNVTGALPGLSWHQWGEAADSYWLVDGQANWSATEIHNGVNGYQVYAKEAADLKLNPGGYWTKKDWPHAQLRSESSPRKLFSVSEIDRRMKERFGELKFNIS